MWLGFWQRTNRWWNILNILFYQWHIRLLLQDGAYKPFRHKCVRQHVRNAKSHTHTHSRASCRILVNFWICTPLTGEIWCWEHIHMSHLLLIRSSYSYLPKICITHFRPKERKMDERAFRLLNCLLIDDGDRNLPDDQEVSPSFFYNFVFPSSLALAPWG